VFKTNLARSVIQAEATERGEGTLTVRLRQKKHNFGPLAEPFGVQLSFSEEAVDLEAIELDASELAEEATLNATDRVKLALESGPASSWEIAEVTGLAVKTVKNALSGLREQEVVEPTGETENRTEQVRLSVPASLSLYRDAGTIAICSTACSSTNKGRWSFERRGRAVCHIGGWAHAQDEQVRGHPQGLSGGEAHTGARCGHQRTQGRHHPGYA
jgi:hypothetical protein